MCRKCRFIQVDYVKYILREFLGREINTKLLWDDDRGILTSISLIAEHCYSLLLYSFFSATSITFRIFTIEWMTEDRKQQTLKIMEISARQNQMRITLKIYTDKI